MPRFWWLYCIVVGLLRVDNGQAQSLAAQQALDSVRVKYRVPALAAAVIELGRIRCVQGGLRRAGYPETVSLADYFHIGSDTKGVTSLLAGKLVAQGKLQWTSKLLEVVPELRGQALPAYASVTLEDLLTHRAGIHAYTSGKDYSKLPEFTGSVSEKRLQFALCVLQQTPVALSKETVYVYSNAGYVLAALMLERASQHSWEELVAQAFRKLRLHYLVGFPNRHDAQQPWGHWLQEPADTALSALGPTNAYQLRDYMAPAGDLAMPLPDFARLVQLHLRGLLGHPRYLTAATYQRLHFGRPAYAYGWGVSALASTGAPVSFHDGSGGTFYAHAILYPSQRVAFVVLANAGNEAASEACIALRRRLKQLYLQGKL